MKDHYNRPIEMIDLETEVLYTLSYATDGLRTQRTGDNKVYKYIYNGSQLSRMILYIGGETVCELYFTYDASGAPLSVIYDGTTYYYATNLQGDVVAILNSAGTAVVYYTYDAWGNILSVSGDLEYTLGYYNPLRYRGYVYDEETGLYYLQSRYYNPEWGRFISADSQFNTNTILGYNLFAYCNNNPVLLADYNGKGPISALILGNVLVTALKVVATAVASAIAVKAVEKKQALKEKDYTIYTLSDPVSEEVVYVGRTTDFNKRMKAHNLNPARKKLEPDILHENLSYEKARAAEQLYIIYYSTLDKNDKAKNQINGVNPNRIDYSTIMRNGFGLNEALDSILTNEVLILFE